MSIDFTTNEETEAPTPSTPSEPKEFQLRVGSSHEQASDAGKVQAEGAELAAERPGFAASSRASVGGKSGT